MDFHALLERIGGPRTLAIAAAVVALVWVFSRVLARKPDDKHHATTQCTACGWKGSVSKYKPICPKCAATIRL